MARGSIPGLRGRVAGSPNRASGGSPRGADADHPSIRRRPKQRIARRPHGYAHVVRRPLLMLPSIPVAHGLRHPLRGRPTGVRPCEATHRRRSCRKSFARTADVSSPTASAWESINPGPANVTIETRVAVAPASAKRVTGPDTLSVAASRCARPTVACGFDPRTTSAPGARLMPRASASADSGGASRTRSCCSRSGAGGGHASRPSRCPCRRRTRTILCSTRPGRSCTAWASAVTHTSSPSAIRAGRTPARRSSSPSSRGAIRRRLPARS